MIKDSNANAICFRQNYSSMKDSIYSQMEWSIDKLGLDGYFKKYKSPLRLVYTPTGQEILFKGFDDPLKLKSIKARKGYFKYIMYEELEEFDGMEQIRKANQSLMRGTDLPFFVFYTFNPPRSINSWVNIESSIPGRNKVIHESCFLDVPREWLGENFFLEAEELRDCNELAYRHEYLGEAVGTGGAIFTNVTGRVIADDEIKTFDRIRQGIDWGFAVDPFAYVKCNFDTKKKILYIFDEIYKQGLLNEEAAELIKPKAGSKLIYADSAEPKSIEELKRYNLIIRGAEKGKDSVQYGIKFLQQLRSIVIDPVRCPRTYKEFCQYEFERYKDGSFKSIYPDKNNHGIDSTRYALNDEITRKTSILNVVR
jgi:PBSX family phage terminase large subunit